MRNSETLVWNCLIAFAHFMRHAVNYVVTVSLYRLVKAFVFGPLVQFAMQHGVIGTNEVAIATMLPTICATIVAGTILREIFSIRIGAPGVLSREEGHLWAALHSIIGLWAIPVSAGIPLVVSWFERHANSIWQQIV